MAEIVTLTTPVTRTSGLTIDIERIVIDRSSLTFSVYWMIKDTGGVVVQNGSHSYTTPAQSGESSGQQLLNQLNTVNLSTTSLVKRVIQKLQTDGFVGAGTISGTPD